MNNDNLYRICSRIKKIREIKGFSQEYIAHKLDITQNTYSKLERGETALNIDKLDDICNALEIDLNTLLSFDEKQIFNNCKQQGNFGDNNTFVVNTFEKIQELYERMLAAKDLEIELLKEKLKHKQSDK